MEADCRPLSDSELIFLYQHGDQRAFRSLYERWSQKLENFIYRGLGDRSQAEDIVQEVFLRVSRHLHTFDPSKKFSSWMYTIASNMMKNVHRNRSRERVISENRLSSAPLKLVTEFVDYRSAPDRETYTKEMMEVLWASIEQLSPNHRSVFILRELDGRQYEEIASILGLPLGTVKSRLFRAREDVIEHAHKISPWDAK